MLIDNDILYEEAINELIEYSTWAVDVETNGTDAYAQDHICGVGVAVSNDEGNTIKTFYFPFRHQQGTNLSLMHLDDLLTSMSCRTELLGYNFKFDLSFLGYDFEGLTHEKASIQIPYQVHKSNLPYFQYFY